ncbi:MAG: DUF3341 domain-containing protein [Gammaproteobacteria bacterium]|nr:DUF3341 domain-containing protein [Gammaproteobacteria bacterium]
MTLLASFAHEDAALDAARALRENGVDGVDLYSPIPLHGADEALGLGKSMVRVFTLLGGILGAIGGFTLCVWTATRFILPTAGRPVITLPPYLLITYESTILLGTLMTLLGFFVVARLPAWRDRTYRASSNVDRFVISVAGPGASDAEEILRAAGAESIEREESE